MPFLYNQLIIESSYILLKELENYPKMAFEESNIENWIKILLVS